MTQPTKTNKHNFVRSLLSLLTSVQRYINTNEINLLITALGPPSPLHPSQHIPSITSEMSGMTPLAKYKLVFLGDQSVGKTSIITRFMVSKGR